MWVGPALDWGGRGSSAQQRYDRGCGVKMHQLSNLMRWFRLHAMWRTGGEPLQRGSNALPGTAINAATTEKQKRPNHRGEDHWPTRKKAM
jgi:hypothetical protein